MDEAPRFRRDLHTVARDIRVAPARARGSPTTAFVERLAERRVRRHVGPAGPDQVLLRRVSPRFISTHHRHERAGDRYDIHWNATVLLPIVQTLRERVAGGIRPLAQQTPSASAAAVGPTVVRALSRTVRQESAAGQTPVSSVAVVPGATSPASAAAQLMVRAGSPPLMVARRALPATVTEREAAAPSATSRPASAQAMPPRPPRLDDLPAGEVNRLTDRVIRDLERRATAFRERKGRS
jgi:hypothetical protein